MNYFLMMIILGLCGSGYYEYTTLQQKSATDQKQLNDLGSKVATLQTENKKLEDDKATLTKSVTDLTKQLQTDGLTEARKQALQPQNNGVAAGVPVSPSSSPNSLETIVTLDGKTYQNCRLLKIDADGIVINYSEGITKVLYALMRPEMQKRFGYDPHQAAATTEAQIQYQEEQKKAAAAAAGN